MNLPTLGKSTLVGQTGILVAFGPGNQHPEHRDHTLCLSLYATSTGLIVCLSEDEVGHSSGFSKTGLGAAVPMERVMDYAERFIQPLPTTKQFQGVIGALRDDF